MTKTGAPGRLGAIPFEGGVHFSVWSTIAQTVSLNIVGESEITMNQGPDQVFSCFVPYAVTGTQYHFRVNGGELLPDPRSRYQPQGPHGPSEVVDLLAYQWQSDDWETPKLAGMSIYEIHVGTYTQAGKFEALRSELPEIASLGVDAIALMPMADFPGERNWGYDGVCLFAPSRNYGRPEDLQELIDSAHGLGLCVILDVVYNHLGPDGNVLRNYSPEYFTDAHQTPWGDALNYDGPESAQVRAFMRENASQWIAEYRFDGLRVDATEFVIDTSPTHVLIEIQETARSSVSRPIVIIAEESRNLVNMVHSPEDGGYGLDAVWADDFHHAVHVKLTGEQKQYYRDYSGDIHEIAKAINSGFIFQGQTSSLTGQPRGTTVTNEPPFAFTFCIQNHDQVGNRPFGERLHHLIDRDRYAATSALLLFLPNSIVLFMGQEFGASTPFLYFTDQNDQIGTLIAEGRRREFSGFPEFADDDQQKHIPDSQSIETFAASQLRLKERTTNKGIYDLYKDLLALRKLDADRHGNSIQRVSASPLNANALVVNRTRAELTNTLITNFGHQLTIDVTAYPELAHLKPSDIRIEFSTSDTRYGGTGEPVNVVTDKSDSLIVIPARSSVLLSQQSCA